MLLIGSRALLYFEDSYWPPGRASPKDVDLIATYSEFEALVRAFRDGGERLDAVYPIDKGKKMVIKNATRQAIIEVEIAWEGSTAAALMVLLSEYGRTLKRTIFGLDMDIAGVETLFALKASHRYLRNSPHFEKTRRDYLHLRKKVGPTVAGWLEDWFKAREKETYWYKHPNLSQDKKGFFNGDGVKYVYDHDSIHVAVAMRDGVPAYTRYQKDGAQVACDRQKWEALPCTLKLEGVVEEAMVLALERSQIPHPGVLTPAASFKMALQKVCTSITSGWFREFAYEAYDEALAYYPTMYVNDFWAKVAAGQVKLA